MKTTKTLLMTRIESESTYLETLEVGSKEYNESFERLSKLLEINGVSCSAIPGSISSAIVLPSSYMMVGNSLNISGLQLPPL